MSTPTISTPSLILHQQSKTDTKDTLSNSSDNDTSETPAPKNPKKKLVINLTYSTYPIVEKVAA